MPKEIGMSVSRRLFQDAKRNRASDGKVQKPCAIVWLYLGKFHCPFFAGAFEQSEYPLAAQVPRCRTDPRAQESHRSGLGKTPAGEVPTLVGHP